MLCNGQTLKFYFLTFICLILNLQGCKDTEINNSKKKITDFLKKGETIKFDSIQSSNWSNNDEIELRKKIKREKEKSEIFDNTYKTFTNTTMDSINSSTTNCKDTSKSKDTTTCNLCNCKDKTCRLCKNLITKNILPESNNYYSLGQPNLVWKDIFCGPNSLHIGNSVIGTTGFNNTI